MVKITNWKKTEQQKVIFWDLIIDGNYTGHKLILNPYDYSATNKWQLHIFKPKDVNPKSIFSPSKEKVYNYAIKYMKSFAKQ